MVERKDEPGCDCGKKASVVSTDGNLYCYECAIENDCCPHCGEQF